jgi:hypothetical protein
MPAIKLGKKKRKKTSSVHVMIKAFSTNASFGRFVQATALLSQFKQVGVEGRDAGSACGKNMKMEKMVSHDYPLVMENGHGFMIGTTST